MVHCKQNEILVLLTIPLSPERYESDYRRANRLLNLKNKDFIIKETIRLGYSWEEYFNNVAKNILIDINELSEKSSCTIDYDVTFKAFSKALRAENYKLIVLFAHHYHKNEEDGIEFADECMRLEKIEKSIRKNAKNKTLFLFVCDSKFIEAIQKKNKLFYRVASANFKIHTTASFTFIKEWILLIGESNTWDEAYSTAIIKHLKE